MRYRINWMCGYFPTFPWKSSSAFIFLVWEIYEIHFSCFPMYSENWVIAKHSQPLPRKFKGLKIKILKPLLHKKQYIFSETNEGVRICRKLYSSHTRNRFWSLHFSNEINKLKCVQRIEIKIMKSLQMRSYAVQLKELSIFSQQNRLLKSEMITVEKCYFGFGGVGLKAAVTLLPGLGVIPSTHSSPLYSIKQSDKISLEKTESQYKLEELCSRILLEEDSRFVGDKPISLNWTLGAGWRSSKGRVLPWN